MQLDYDKAIECFKKVKHIKEHTAIYCLSKDHIPVSIEDLFWVVGDMYGLRIAKKAVSYASSRVPSLVERNADGSATVYVSSSLDLHFQRFAATKELMHLVVDEQEDWSANGTETLRGLLTEMSINGPNLPSKSVQSEVFAEIAAIEILYPYEFRKLDQSLVSNGESNIVKLALHYEIPQLFISRALTPWYEKIADRLWCEIQSEKNA